MTVQASIADEPKKADSDGYKNVTLAGGQVIRVKQQADPFSHLSSSDQKLLNRTNEMGSKTFSSQDASVSKNDSAIEERERSTFITRPYLGNSQSTSSPANLDAKISLPTSSLSGHITQGFDRSFTSSKADTDQNRTVVLASLTSSDQGRTAALGQKKTDTFASSYSTKAFTGPEADDVHRDLQRLNNGLMELKDLPSRPLTIDEVRALIDHGTKPNTDEKPDAPTKPLNDPDYKPVPSPMLPVANDEDKNDPVPSPGMMAAPQPPENSEPLPQH